MDGHRTAERRSLAYHRAIAARLADAPELVAAAQVRVASWTPEQLAPRWRAAWLGLLEGPLESLLHAIVEDSERMRDLRQVSPFAGALDARERWAIWRAVP